MMFERKTTKVLIKILENLHMSTLKYYFLKTESVEKQDLKKLPKLEWVLRYRSRAKRFITVSLTVILLNLSCPPFWLYNSTSFANQPAHQNSQNYLAKGRTEFDKGQYSLTVKHLSEALKLDPNLAEAYFHRARALDLLGQPMRALKDVEKYIELSPRDPNGYILRGDINNFNLDHTDAIDSYNQALRIDPRSIDARIGRGLAYTALEKYDLAIKDYEDIIRKNPYNQDALTNLGIALALSGRKKEAIEKLTEALALERNLDWRSRLNKMIDDLSQATTDTLKKQKTPFNNNQNNFLNKPW